MKESRLARFRDDTDDRGDAPGDAAWADGQVLSQSDGFDDMESCGNQ